MGKKKKVVHEPVKCRLLPFERTDCLSMQDVRQKVGWQISAFDLPRAWKFSEGENVVIGVLDTGCDLEHNDLQGALLDGINLVKRGKPPIDGCGHGTHVTGILVAQHNEIGVVGVCPKAKVRPIKVLDDRGNGNMDVVAEGIRWAADNGCHLLVLSLGAPVKVAKVYNAIKYAATKGTVTFCASGNAGKTKDIFYPANYAESIAIGAIDEDFKRADFSNVSKNIDFMAPGVDVLSTVPESWYAMLSGTSMACPFAVGIAALVKSYSLSGKGGFKLDTTDDYRNLLRQYTIPMNKCGIGDPNRNQEFRIIDPRKFLPN